MEGCGDQDPGPQVQQLEDHLNVYPVDAMLGPTPFAQMLDPACLPPVVSLPHGGHEDAHVALHRASFS